MKTTKFMKEISEAMHRELYRHHRARQNQFLMLQWIQRIDDSFKSLVLDHPQVVYGFLNLYSGERIGLFVYLKRDGSLKDMTPIFEWLLEHGWTLPKPERRDLSYIEYVWVSKDKPDINVYVFPDWNSKNCKQVEVGTQPIYEWKCVD